MFSGKIFLKIFSGCLRLRKETKYRYRRKFSGKGLKQFWNENQCYIKYLGSKKSKFIKRSSSSNSLENREEQYFVWIAYKMGEFFGN